MITLFPKHGIFQGFLKGERAAPTLRITWVSTGPLSDNQFPSGSAANQVCNGHPWGEAGGLGGRGGEA